MSEQECSIVLQVPGLVQHDFIDGEVIEESTGYTGGYVTFDTPEEQALYRVWLHKVSPWGQK